MKAGPVALRLESAVLERAEESAATSRELPFGNVRRPWRQALGKQTHAALTS
jgi:hypothetical protein